MDQLSSLNYPFHVSPLSMLSEKTPHSKGCSRAPLEPSDSRKVDPSLPSILLHMHVHSMCNALLHLEVKTPSLYCARSSARLGKIGFHVEKPSTPPLSIGCPWIYTAWGLFRSLTLWPSLIISKWLSSEIGALTHVVIIIDNLMPLKAWWLNEKSEAHKMDHEMFVDSLWYWIECVNGQRGKPVCAFKRECLI